MALAAQGFGKARPAKPHKGQMRKAIDQLEVLQIDSVNVLCRAHYLPLFSRLGNYSRETLDAMAWGPKRELFEYWGHRASLLPFGMYPLMRWRMDAGLRQRFDWELKDYAKHLTPGVMGAPWAAIEGLVRLADAGPALLDQVLAEVTERGPIGAGAITSDAGPAEEGGAMWNWRDAKIAMEWLFYCGKVTVAGRRHFERLYDLTERVIPAEVRDATPPAPEDAQRELVRRAARAQGTATERELRRYFHLPTKECKARIAELVESGELIRVDGTKLYQWHEAEAPAAIDARALLSPFDSLIWDRDRMLRLFGMHYRIGIYTPAAKRDAGYYVLPFLLGDRLVARVDLKADRRNSALLVQGAHSEPGAPDSTAELGDELRLMADWLELDKVTVNGTGDLAGKLR